MGKPATNVEALDILGRALELEYQFIVHYPRIGRMVDNDEIATRVQLLGDDSVKHADAVAAAISELGGIAPFPALSPLPDPLVLKKFFEIQLDLEQRALDLHSEAAAAVGDELEALLRRLADQERWHIKAVQDIIARLE